MTFEQFALMQDYLIAYLWPPIVLWMVLFVAGGIMLALYHAFSRVVRERLLS